MVVLCLFRWPVPCCPVQRDGCMPVSKLAAPNTSRTFNGSDLTALIGPVSYIICSMTCCPRCSPCLADMSVSVCPDERGSSRTPNAEIGKTLEIMSKDARDEMGADLCDFCSNGMLACCCYGRRVSGLLKTANPPTHETLYNIF